jgi:serine/threonine-protein kinase
MRKSLSLLAGLLVVLLFSVQVACAAPTLVYENNTHGFRLSYPDKWAVTEGVMGTVAAFMSPLENSDDKFRENVNVLVQALSEYPGMTLEKYEALSIDDMPKFVTDFKLIDRKDAVISGLPAKTITFTGRQGVFQIKFLQAYIIQNERAFVLTYTAEEAQYKKYLAPAQGIIFSIQIN